MELALLMLVAVSLGGVAWWVRARRDDPGSLSDADLMDQVAVQQQRLARAGNAHPDRHDAALRRLARLTVLMKTRGLSAAASFVDEPLLQFKLEQIAHDRFASTVAGIQARASEGNPGGLFQLAVLLRAAHEGPIASTYLARAAEAGHADAQFALALETLGTEDDQESHRAREALTLLKSAADQGHEQARLAMSGLMQSLPPLAAQAALRAARRRGNAPSIQPAPAAAASPGSSASWAGSLRQKFRR